MHALLCAVRELPCGPQVQCDCEMRLSMLMQCLQHAPCTAKRNMPSMLTPWSAHAGVVTVHSY